MKVIFVSDSKYTSSISSQKTYSVIFLVIVVIICKQEYSSKV